MTDGARSPERNAEIDRAFETALELQGDALAAMLAALRARDADLARAVERLLRAHATPDPRLDPARWTDGRAWSGLFGSGGASAVRAGERVGAYRIVREIGRGGMSVVYEAERADGAFEQRVAIKFLGIVSEAAVRRFERERRILASLSHPNIARLLDGGTDARGRPYIVMEYVEGRRIDAHCAAVGAGVEQRIALVATVAAAVEYAHAQLIVHRDIKPSNVLVAGDGTVKLLDFGIARLLDPVDPAESGTSPGGPEAATATHVRLLTPEYASPEQVRGERVTVASDVYQLGMLLYELLAGSRPFTLGTASAAEIERVVCTVDPVPPSRASKAAHGVGATPTGSSLRAAFAAPRRRLSGDLDTIVLKALAKEPQQRYPSARALIEDLHRLRAGLPISARRPTLRYRVTRFVQRHRVAVATAALVLLSLLAGLATTTWQAQLAARERDRAERARMHAETISDFLVEIFDVSDPERTSARDVTARELLDRGARRVRYGEDDAQLTAALTGVMGRAYRSLGLYDDAEPLLEAAVARQRSAGGDEAALAGALDQLGRLRFEQRRLAEADSLYHEALAIRRRLYGAEHADIALTLRNLSELRLVERDLDAAERLAAESLEMRRRLLGEADAAVAAAYTDLGRVHLFKGELDAAADRFTDAIMRQRRLSDGPRRDLATSLNHLGQVRHNQGDHAAADSLYSEAHALLARVLGPDHPQTADTYNNLGALHYSRGSYEAAAEIFENVLAARRRTLGPDHPLLGHTLHNLASVAVVLGDLERAEAGFLASLEIRRAVYGSEHTDVALTLWGLASLWRRQGRLAEAESGLRQAAQVYRSGMPATRATLGRVLVDHGSVLLQQGRARDAAAQLAEGLEILETLYDASDERVRLARERLGEARALQRTGADRSARGG